MEQHIDFLAIGDTVIDAFIRLNDAEIVTSKDGHTQLLGVRYGDKVPFESVEICNAVGNAANAAVSAARLGLQSAILTYLGNDAHGTDCKNEFTKNGVSLDFVRTEDGKTTNYPYVLWYDVDRTILIKHEAFNYELGDIGSPKWIYLSSLGEHSAHMYEAIASYLETHPEIKLAFQPGIFDIKQGTEKLSHIYSHAEAICMNVEEAQRVLNIQDRDLKVLLSGLAALGPKNVFITDGIDGAYAYSTAAPDTYWFMPIYPHAPFERTGAGDAFFSTVISALELGKPINEALAWGPINSMSVVQFVGAQKGLLTEAKLSQYLAEAPADYQPRVI